MSTTFFRVNHDQTYDVLRPEFGIIGAGERLGLLGRGARGFAWAAGIQNAELELGGSADQPVLDRVRQEVFNGNTVGADQ